MAIENVSFSNLATQSILNSQQSSISSAASGQISTEDFENVLNQYLSSYTNQSSKKSSPLASALGADDALINELLSSSNGRKAITQMTSNHLMNVVTSTSDTTTTSSTDDTDSKIKALQEEAKTKNDDSASSSQSSTSSMEDTFTTLADLLQSSNLKVNTK